MSIARHHAEWLSLVESSGPFLSMPVLMRVFPQGLDQRDTSRASRLREFYEEWLEEGEHKPGLHRAWVLHVLTELLEYPSDLLVEGQAIPAGIESVQSQFGETLRPDWVLKHRESDRPPQLLICLYPPTQDLDGPVAGKIWKATPGTRMMELLHSANVPLGLVTNGEQWMIVYAPRGEATGFASWYADLWMQEPLTLRAFHSLLHLRRFLGVAQDDTLSALYKASSEDQQEVTDQLGYQVRRAVEVLVQAFDRIDTESGRTLLKGVSEKELYDSALTVMMRLVFLFSAEERELLLLGDPLYDQHYAVSTLRELLRERADQHGEEILERRHDAWCRLLATFRAVHAGVEHEAMRLPAYGSSLFDPDRFPFLEGRSRGSQWISNPAKPLLINNRVVLHLLEALQILRVKVPGGGPAEARRLSFRALDIEQIGHVYEGLLDHTAVRAGEIILGLSGTRDKEPEIPLAKLEELRARGGNALVDFLKDETDRSLKTLQRALDESFLDDEHRLFVACGQDESLMKRVKPFAGLIREDSFGHLMIIPKGSAFVTQGSDRRSTGTHYTPRSLTEPIVRYALEPIVYVGPAEGKPESEWQLKSPKEILNIKVCDPAMGSGAFLVQTCRYLSERLVEAWEKREKQEPGAFLKTPEGDLSAGDPSERLLPADSAERLTIARRYVADRCLYGVDLNPMAVEMAKLSLWLVTLQKDRPFTFLNHALRCGDSLIGIHSFEQAATLHLKPDTLTEDKRASLWSTDGFARTTLVESVRKRKELEVFQVRDIQDVHRKEVLLAEAERSTEIVRVLCDLVCHYGLQCADGGAAKRNGAMTREFESKRGVLVDHCSSILEEKDVETRTGKFIELLSESLDILVHKGKERHPFHWPIEFPEVFEARDGQEGGFDVIVGNPPFMGGQKITGELGTDYRNLLVDYIADGRKGSADLCTFFLLRARQICRPSGNFALLTTNTIAQGDTREVGLDALCQDGCTIYRGIQSRKWPGQANLEIAEVWLHRGQWRGAHFLEENPVKGITPFLSVPGVAKGRPFCLEANVGKSFIGTYVLGMGFVLTPEEANTLMKRHIRNRDVLSPYLNGEDLNTRPNQTPSRWVINFLDWPLNREAEGYWDSADEEQQKTWLRSGSVPKDYPGKVAADYPDCLAIVETKVKPERMRLKRKIRRDRWWQYAERAPKLYSTIAGLKQVLVRPNVSRTHAPVFLVPDKVFSLMCVVFAYDQWSYFTVLQSNAHEVWVGKYSSNLRTDQRYTPSDCFETFPFPQSIEQLDGIGEHYHNFRQSIMTVRHEGLTTTYNRFHRPTEKSTDIAELRHLHVEMDQAVASAYGWTDLDLGHGFHQTRQGLRYTISEPARQEVLDRLLELNHARYAEEVKQGLHEEKKGKGGGKRKKVRAADNTLGNDLFSEVQNEE